MVSFKKGGLVVRCHAWDRNLGGRDVDELLYDHFCKEIQERFKLDVRSNAKASFKLRLQCQRLKKVGYWGGPAKLWCGRSTVQCTAQWHTRCGVDLVQHWACTALQHRSALSAAEVVRPVDGRS